MQEVSQTGDDSIFAYRAAQTCKSKNCVRSYIDSPVMLRDGTRLYRYVGLHISL